MFGENEKEDTEIARNFSKAVDSMADRMILRRFLLIGVLTNFLIWSAVFLKPEMIYKGFSLVNTFSNKLSLGLLGIPLIFTTFTIYALFRLKFPDIEEQRLDSEIMSSHTYQINSAKRYIIWVCSFAVGIVNTILLIMADIYLQ